MAKKKSNLITIIPAFLLMGAAVGIQTTTILRDTAIGLIVGIIVYFFFKHRNKIINNKKS
jgi:biopolymer transport protein ExbB/TolQ